MENTPTPLSPFPAKAAGFTLVELMIVVAIVALLGAIAYPSYRDHMRRSNRTVGKALLTDAAARQERRFSEAGAYTANMTNLGFPADPTVSDSGFYSVDATVAPAGCCETAGGGCTTCTSFTLTATTVAGGGQQDDTHCASMSITQAGVKSATNTDCW
jgi:type IV pilus assembly protein PilE